MAGPWEKFSGKPWERFSKAPVELEEPTPGFLDYEGWGKKLEDLDLDKKPLWDRVQALPQVAYYTARQVPGIEAAAAGKILQTAGRVMDYPAGYVRTGVGAALGLGEIEDLKRALKGEAPRVSELMERGDIPAGPSMNVPYFGQVSARDAAGFAGDVALDPLTYETFGLNRLVGEGVKDTGKAIYKSGLKKLDQKVAQYGKEPVSDVLLKERVWGSADNIQKEMDQLADMNLKDRDGILRQATNAGAEVDVNKALEPAQEYVNKLIREGDPRSQGTIEALQRQIEKIRSGAAVESEQVIRELPYTVEQEVFRQNPENVLNYVETPGVSGPQSVIKTPTPEDPYASALLSRMQRAERKAGGVLAENVDNLKAQAAKDAATNPQLNVVTGRKNQASLYEKLPGEQGSGLYNEPFIGPGQDITLQQNSLPVQGRYETVRVPQVATVIDQTERIPGPTPIQTNAWKRNAANAAGDEAYNQILTTPTGSEFEKKVAYGFRKETERAVNDALGNNAGQRLHQTNDELGRLLTSQERAMRDAAIEGNKNLFTSVDSMNLHYGGPAAFATKKAADFAKTSAGRTGAGLLLYDFGQTRAPDVFARRSYINQVSPWLNMNKEKEK